MSDITYNEKFRRLDNKIWKKSKVDVKGRTTIPVKLRRRLGLNVNSEILWISSNRRNGKNNEFFLQIGIKNLIDGNSRDLKAENVLLLNKKI